jgi:hypothetical protein
MTKKRTPVNKLAKKPTPVPRPSMSILDAGFQYTNSSSTNVTMTWMRHGWVPPSLARGEKA